MEYADAIAKAKAQITEVTVEQFAANPGLYDVVIDVREPHEHAAGAIPGAVLVPMGQLAAAVTSHANPTQSVLLYCGVGARSAIGAQALQQLGFTNVVSLAGGYNLWHHHQEYGTNGGLTASQRDRYARHLILDGIGEAGQLRLLESSVLIVGAGGLGSPAALYLVAAGVGKIGLVDADVVEVSNLQRQIVHNVDRLGRPKAMSAAETLDRINPECDIRVHETRLVAANAREIIDGYEIIIDATDNFPTRYLLNDASIITGKPVVHGSIFRFEGQASVFEPGNGPCYRCLFPEPPPAELAPNCAEAGVLGVLPGIV
ncbi:MAG: molybdopterin biosynthesis protein MoeB, partial [Acidimicrobiia bacterium]|nr:molybdopterin biosynthesis protein MoeB [Acidimicrobiia bacterium]